MTGGIRIGRVLGIEVVMDWSLLIIFGLITVSLGAGLFPTWHPEWPASLSWLTALGAAVLFFVSVFLHELSHAIVGRALGMEIPRITLFVFGGMAHIEREPHAWRAELWMAAAGPVASLVIGVVFILLGSMAAGPAPIDPERPQRVLQELGPLATLLFWLGPVNIILALFNLVPGFPLDGGRVLRAIMWGLSGDLRLATRWASWGGRAFAWLLIFMGVAMIFGHEMPVLGSGLVNGLWLAFIGWFLNNAALMSYHQLLVHDALEDVHVRRLMQTDPVSVPPDMTVGELIDAHLLGTGQRTFPVVRDGEFAGLVSFQDIRRVPRAQWAEVRVADIMTPAKELVSVTPDDDAVDAMVALNRRGVNQLPVLEDGRVVGMLRREDLLKWISLYADVPDSPLRSV